MYTLLIPPQGVTWQRDATRRDTVKVACVTCHLSGRRERARRNKKKGRQARGTIIQSRPTDRWWWWWPTVHPAHAVLSSHPHHEWTRRPSWQDVRPAHSSATVNRSTATRPAKKNKIKNLHKNKLNIFIFPIFTHTTGGVHPPPLWGPLSFRHTLHLLHTETPSMQMCRRTGTIARDRYS